MLLRYFVEMERPALVLRIATYNIRKCVGLDWRRRPDRVIDVLGELGADIVAVQEADRRFGERTPTLPTVPLSEEAGLVPVPTPPASPSSGHHGNAILIGRDAQVIGTTSLDLPSLEPRGAMIADIAVRGVAVTVVAVHLGLRAADRLRQAETILAEIAKTRDPRRTVILGDMNAWSRTSKAIRLLSADYQPSEPLKTFHSAMPVAPLDRIFLGQDFSFGRTFVHRSPAADVASDHLPVCADITVADGSRTGRDAPTAKEAAPSTTP
ncbi:MAG: endonuclease/exonuclease/phosphatase family protein [Devosia sp.]